MLVVAGDGSVLYANRAAYGAWGCAVELTGARLESLFADGYAKVAQAMQLWSRTRDPVPAGLTLAAPDGERIECRCDGAVCSAGDGPLHIAIRCRPKQAAAQQFVLLNEKVEALASEVKERRATEELLSRQNRALEMVATGEPMEAILAQLVRIVEDRDRDALASILLFDTADQRLRHGAAPSLPEEYNRAIDGLRAGPCAGSCGTAACRGEAVIVTDIATDPLWAEYRHLALRHGLRACWSIPIVSAEKVVLGTFAVYYREPRGPSPENLRTLEFVTRTASLAISRCNTERQLMDLLWREGEARGEAERSREHAINILESVRDAFIALDDEFRFTYVNGAAEALLGRSRLQLLGRIIWQEYGDLVGTAVERAYRGVLADRTPATFEFFYSALDRWFETNAFPAAAGGMSVYFRDVTDRKRQEEALRSYRYWLEAVLDLMPSPMLFIEPGTAKVTFANRAANEMAGGIFPKDVAAEDYARVYQLRDSAGRALESHEYPGVRVARGERLDGVEFIWPTAHGERNILVFGGMLPAMHAQPATAVLKFQDVSNWKRAEEAVRQAQRLESLGVLAGGVAHDFNNLLTPILGNASVLLASRSVPRADRELLTDLIVAAERAADLTRQLLAYAGKGQFSISRFDMAALITDMTRLIRTSTSPKVTLDVHLEDGAVIEGDAAQIQQVVMNLILNAAEAIGVDSAGVVTVRSGIVSIDAALAGRLPLIAGKLPPGKYVLFEVEDTGCGMDEATQARIFDPFFTTKFLGRGLGLSAVLGIVRSHKGAMCIRSQVNRGSTFSIFFPPAAASLPAPPTRALSAACARETGVVLVVDDDEGVRRFAARALERGGYTVLLAENGAEAIRLLESRGGAADLVLLDWMMPEMSAADTVPALRERFPQLKILLTSGFSEAQAKLRFGDEDVQGFLQKPYSASVLLNAVSRLLEGRTLSAARN